MASPSRPPKDALSPAFFPGTGMSRAAVALLDGLALELHQLLEVVRAGNKVRFAIYFDHHAELRVAGFLPSVVLTLLVFAVAERVAMLIT